MRAVAVGAGADDLLRARRAPENRWAGLPGRQRIPVLPTPSLPTPKESPVLPATAPPTGQRSPVLPESGCPSRTRSLILPANPHILHKTRPHSSGKTTHCHRWQGPFLPAKRPLPPVARPRSSGKIASVTGDVALFFRRSCRRHRWRSTGAGRANSCVTVNLPMGSHFAQKALKTG